MLGNPKSTITVVGVAAAPKSLLKTHLAVTQIASRWPRRNTIQRVASIVFPRVLPLILNSPQGSEPILLQHKVFSYFRPFSGPVPAFCEVDFLGTLTRHEFVAGLLPGRCYPIEVQDYYPDFDEEYFEWIALLEAVVSARGSFTMIELGAGFGRWTVRAAAAWRQCHPDLPIRLIAVEPEPVVFGWMRQHFADNDVDERGHSLIHAAISDAPGSAMFYIGGPRGGPFDRHPNSWYGQALTKDYDAAGLNRPDGVYAGFRVIEHSSGWRSIRIPTLSLRCILKDLDGVDLIDLDIEGQELISLSQAIEELDAKVKRLHIGTHSREIETGLRHLLPAHGWQCQADHSLHSSSQTPWGVIHFENGVQSWVNPRLS